MFLWVEACNETMYVQNKRAHMILGDKNVEEAFSILVISGYLVV
jgi:hypothetical protein